MTSTTIVMPANGSTVARAQLRQFRTAGFDVESVGWSVGPVADVLSHHFANHSAAHGMTVVRVRSRGAIGHIYEDFILTPKTRAGRRNGSAKRAATIRGRRRREETRSA